MSAGKRRANTVLAVAAGVFVLALILKVNYPDSRLAAALLIMAEAGLAGGVADWFAVTALFRRPLGFPYHTALIPRNREKVIAALAQAVEQDFLSVRALTVRLQQIKLLDKVITYSQTTSLRPAVRAMVEKAIEELTGSLDAAAIGKLGDRLVKLLVKRQSLAPYAANGISWVLRQGREWDIYAAVVTKLAILARRPQTQEAIYHYLEQIKEATASKNWLTGLLTGLMEVTDGINLTDAADALQQELVKAADELAAEDHPLFGWFQAELGSIAVRLETPEWQAVLDDWKNEVVDRLDLAQPLTALGEAVLAACSQPTVYRDYVVDWLTDQLASYWRQFQTNEELQSQAEAYLKLLITKVIEQEHALVGQIASRALSKLSEEELNQFVEDKTGEDLDWIRINGVVIGGLIGAGLALLRLL